MAGRGVVLLSYQRRSAGKLVNDLHSSWILCYLRNERSRNITYFRDNGDPKSNGFRPLVSIGPAARQFTVLYFLVRVTHVFF